MNGSEIEVKHQEKDIQQLPRIGVNNADRLAYVNGELRLQFSLNRNDSSWRIFEHLAKNPSKVISTARLMSFMPKESLLLDEVRIIGAALTNEIYSGNAIQEVWSNNKIVGFRLNAKVMVVKL